ncbi:MAG TPA: transposase, partial [Candidatus Sulfotelmatobacter sp.]|nr:transposase [Candidatus Sulfotelmatobacter sp.]
MSSSKSTSRRFTNEYKARILKQVDEMRHGDVEDFLRREGLSASQITEWRKQRDQAIAKWLEPQRPGPKPKDPNPLAAELAQLKREQAELEKRLQQAEEVIKVQRKISE